MTMPPDEPYPVDPEPLDPEDVPGEPPEPVDEHLTVQHYENEPPDPEAVGLPDAAERPTALDLTPPVSSGPAQSL
jgi:hypothetical protein